MTLRIYRSKEIVNFAGRFDVFVDGKKIDAIDFGKEYKDFEIEGKESNVQIKIQWCGSNILKTRENIEINEMIASSRLNSVTTFMIVFFMIVFGYLAYSINGNFKYLMFLIYLYPLYYISFGRNKYLILNFK